jgi:hypothetical protein
MNGKITEQHLIEYLEVILKSEGEISLQEFTDRIPKAFSLSDYDLGKSQSRPSESRYEQRCRNIVSHRSFPQSKINYLKQTFVWVG